MPEGYSDCRTAVQEASLTAAGPVIATPLSRAAQDAATSARTSSRSTGWSAEAGAASAYLQVRAQNTPALRLYESMGFKTAYGYHYRVPG